MEKIVIWLSRILAVLSAIAIVIMVIAIAIDVYERNTSGASMPGMIELAETAMVTAVAFGLAWAGVKGEHVSVTILTDRFSDTWMRAVNVLVWAIATAYVGWLCYANLLRSMDSTRMREERFGIIQWPMYPMRWILFAGFVSLLLVCLLNLVKSLMGKEPLGFSDEVEATLAEQESIKQDQPETNSYETVSAPNTSEPTIEKDSDR